ncbi:MAG: rRNA pseudouridine synthase [Bacteroidales bacterium]|nr:rRNA pseudouridine synthase [Bacteroidales bacterium]
MQEGKGIKYKKNIKCNTDTYSSRREHGNKIRLNRFIANSGVCSRRKADELITKGLITVNGKVVRELGSKVKIDDDIRYRNRKLLPEKKVYILLNKPKGYVTTTSDPHAEKTVMQLVGSKPGVRLWPAGRLDKNTTGVMLLTNDGELAKRLTHPSFEKKKVYHVYLNKYVTKSDLEAMVNGIDIGGKTVSADAIAYADNNDKSQVGIEIHSGENRIIKRMFERLGYKVLKLDRVYFAGLTKKNLPRGEWRYLTQKEIIMLKRGAYN